LYYLHLLAEPPSFIQSLPAETKVAEGENVTLSCLVVGTPKPIVSWKIGNRPLQLPYQGLFDRDHIMVDNNGRLVILASISQFLAICKISIELRII
jgi:hypothetical protein